MASDTATVLAAGLRRHGEPLVVERVELATPRPDEIRVELEYGGVNPFDSYIAQGRVSADAPLPRTLGGEAAGISDGRPVLVAGEELGTVREGVWAQAAVVPGHSVVPIPDGVALQDAAAMGVAGLTALSVVREVALVTSTDRVLVLGASGGVGSMIVSLAHSVGATVWGQTASPRKLEGITAQGADHALVAGPAELGELVKEWEPTVVFDGLGGQFVAPVVETIAPLGRIVSFGTSAGPSVNLDMQILYRKSLSLLGYGGMRLDLEERRRDLEATLAALADGSIHVRVDGVLPLAKVNDAFARLRDRDVQGKLLLELSG
jgi:NADPH2:quinone reductase